jgi:3-hydroxyisobutyrate dehydrogenase-like beta-hydroxyacid dehydrogenase
VVAEADVILVVTPPGAAVDAATEIAAMAATSSVGRPLVVDLNAISPTTAATAAEVVTAVGLDFVDGSISGPPPTVRPGATIFLSGPRADEVADLSWQHVKPVVVGDRIGAASAVKMSTASVYKGLTALMAQAIRSAAAHGVLEPVMADLGEKFATPYEVALASTKAHRYVAEMHEIARSQAAAGLTPASSRLSPRSGPTSRASLWPTAIPKRFRATSPPVRWPTAYPIEPSARFDSEP